MLAPVIRQTSYSYEFTHPPKWWWNPNAQYPLMWLYLEIESLYMITRWHSDTNSACHCRRLRRCRFDPWARKIPWRREWQPTPISLSGKSHGQRNLARYSPRSCKQLDTTECWYWKEKKKVFVYDQVKIRTLSASDFSIISILIKGEIGMQR